MCFKTPPSFGDYRDGPYMPSHANVKATPGTILRGSSDSASPALVPRAATLARPEGERRYLVAAPPGRARGRTTPLPALAFSCTKDPLIRYHGGKHCAEPSRLKRYPRFISWLTGVQNADLEVAEAAWEFFRHKQRRPPATP